MNLRRNVRWNVIEVLVSSLVLFLIYKLIASRLGVAALGVWSVVLATTSLARVADVGAAGGLARYIAISDEPRSPNNNVDALIYVETALIVNVVLYSAIAIALYWPAYWALGHVTKGGATVEARILLPFAVGSFVMMNLSSVFSSALLGFHRSYQKSILMLGSLIVQVSVSVALIPSLGLRGLAIGQLAQHAVLCVSGWALVVRICSGRFSLTLPHRIGHRQIRELLGFGLKLQSVNVVSFLYEPATKFVFSAVGGVHALGVFEMASRLVIQARQLLVMPSMNLTPIFAAKSVGSVQDLERTYLRAFLLVSSLAAAGFAGLCLVAPVVSRLWLGKVEWTFVTYVAILSLGWLVNSIAVPAYLMGVGLGRLRWNLLGGGVTTVLSPLGGLILAPVFGTSGLTLAASLGIGVGAALTMIMNCKSAGVAVIPTGRDAGASVREVWSFVRGRLQRRSGL